MSLKCRCDSKPCSGSTCPCSKSGVMCGDLCHMRKPWSSVPCLNTDHGSRVRSMKIGEVRQALCDAGLSPVGDKNELMKRLAVHYSSLTGNNANLSLSFINIIKQSILHCTSIVYSHSTWVGGGDDGKVEEEGGGEDVFIHFNTHHLCQDLTMINKEKMILEVETVRQTRLLRS